MKLIVGLGNPGPKYEITRHNAGFLMIDLLADRNRVSVDQDKFRGQMGRGRIEGEDCLLLKPQTFMNLSGESVRDIAKFYKLDDEDIIVLHDDVDVPFGKVKMKIGGGHGGNNGIRSILDETPLTKFYRLKLGVGKPGPDDPMSTASWVLGRFTEDEVKVLETTMLDDVVTRLKNIFKR